jgi:hypothetical protein
MGCTILKIKLKYSFYILIMIAFPLLGCDDTKKEDEKLKKITLKNISTDSNDSSLFFIKKRRIVGDVHNDKVLDLYKSYGDRVLLSAYFIDDFRHHFSYTYGEDTTITSLSFRIGSMSIEDKKRLISVLSKYFNSFDIKKQLNLKKSIHLWCSIDSMIEGLEIMGVREDIDYCECIFEQIIYEELKDKRFLIDKFLTIEGQTWASLTTNQLLLLRYDTINYLCKLSTQKRLEFFAQYTKICIYKLKKCK